jgi:hypothetical protein
MIVEATRTSASLTVKERIGPAIMREPISMGKNKDKAHQPQPMAQLQYKQMPTRTITAFRELRLRTA